MLTALNGRYVRARPAVTGPLLEAVGRALTGRALGNRRSPFAGRQGEQAAAGLVRLVEDGTFPAAPDRPVMAPTVLWRPAARQG
jgi:predicted Zn-dependent protease